ncbi:Sperm-tail_PG-rich repeat [Hexamita inflata]|uniref:Sperm-tail PG-rich repeat n=1 Tax=Hexamita inflata TaxID=28002 RepID=A0AA86TJR0_9EUKA|nr:Sperm-tail PG-rich repeat [Hexamita inflata]
MRPQSANSKPSKQISSDQKRFLAALDIQIPEEKHKHVQPQYLNVKPRPKVTSLPGPGAYEPFVPKQNPVLGKMQRQGRPPIRTTLPGPGDYNIQIQQPNTQPYLYKRERFTKDIDHEFIKQQLKQNKKVNAVLGPQSYKLNFEYLSQTKGAKDVKLSSSDRFKRLKEDDNNFATSQIEEYQKKMQGFQFKESYRFDYDNM